MTQLDTPATATPIMKNALRLAFLLAALPAPVRAHAGNGAELDPFARFAVRRPTSARLAPVTDEEGPWRIGAALGAPDWLTIEGQHRTRFQTLDEDFRNNRNGHNQLFALRTLLKATVRQEQFSLVTEFQDSRQLGAPSKGFLNTAIVNAVELLQANVALTFEDAFAGGDEFKVILGRHTMDIGARRLVSRNRFRNTINAFTGVNATWKGAGGENARAFFVLPVQRLPRDNASLQDNDIEFDEERKQVKFFGVHGETGELAAGIRGEAFAFGLDEGDGRDLATRNREIYTLGARFHRKPGKGEVGFEVESAYQFGESRASSNPADDNDLDHSAHYHHASAGYRFDVPLDPYFETLFTYASGDENPNDGSNNRFDNLFGARVAELGPTDIFGAFAFANLLSPGYRVGLDVCEDARLTLMHRFHYLASDNDAWTTSGIQDPAGDSGRYLGHLLNARVRWELVPQNLRFEWGIAHLFADGDFLQDAPNSNGVKDTTYFYVGATVWF